MTTNAFTENRERFGARKRLAAQETWRASTRSVAQTLVFIGGKSRKTNAQRDLGGVNWCCVVYRYLIPTFRLLSNTGCVCVETRAKRLDPFGAPSQNAPGCLPWLDIHFSHKMGCRPRRIPPIDALVRSGGFERIVPKPDPHLAMHPQFFAGGQ